MTVYLPLDKRWARGATVCGVENSRREGPCDAGQRQIVRGDQADRAVVEQIAQDAGCALQAIMGIGAVKDFVEEKEQRLGTSRDIRELPDARDFRVEARAPFLERILYAKSGADRQRRESE